MHDADCCTATGGGLATKQQGFNCPLIKLTPLITAGEQAGPRGATALSPEAASAAAQQRFGAKALRVHTVQFVISGQKSANKTQLLSQRTKKVLSGNPAQFSPVWFGSAKRSWLLNGRT